MKRKPLTDIDKSNLIKRREEILRDPKFWDGRFKRPLIQEMEEITDNLLNGIPVPTLTEQQIVDLKNRKREILNDPKYRDCFENRPLVEEFQQITAQLIAEGAER